ncbi:MAG: hypothetical protein LBS31_12620, partial [Candidatus Adiutrix sp.]|nr:hypothetical protein [Candidatus Adiutrix sp.]
MITSFINGRVRLRDERFKDSETSAAAAAAVETCPAVTRVAANPRTGSLLIEYDPARMDMEAARAALLSFCPEGAARLDDEAGEGSGAAFSKGGLADFLGGGCAGGRFNKQAWEYAALLSAFAVCAGSAFLRSKGLHVQS